jgi:hypothetical protein
MPGSVRKYPHTPFRPGEIAVRRLIWVIDVDPPKQFRGELESRHLHERLGCERAGRDVVGGAPNLVGIPLDTRFVSSGWYTLGSAAAAHLRGGGS